MGKKKKIQRKAQRGKVLHALGCRLIAIASESQQFNAETLPALRHAEEQRMQDMHSIESVLEDGDFAAMRKLARTFTEAEGYPIHEDEIPY